ncbi:hypothetical protein JCM10207_002028 [Rhodosporidiobolus poonsookiae]
MYIRGVHQIKNLSELHELVRQTQLGQFTTGISCADQPFLQTTHIPWVLDVDESADEQHLGVLRGHIARVNPQTKAMIAAAAENGELEDEALVIFTAKEHGYVTPKFYAETKPTTGKVVPTWNYSAVQVYGRVKIYDTAHPDTDAFLAQQIADLSREGEASMGFTGAKAWSVDDAPAGYVKQLKRAIVGVEIEITRIEGKAKMSQEMGKGDRQGVIDGFRELGTDDGLAIAATVERKGAEKDAAKAAEAA